MTALSVSGLVTQKRSDQRDKCESHMHVTQQHARKCERERDTVERGKKKTDRTNTLQKGDTTLLILVL